MEFYICHCSKNVLKIVNPLEPGKKFKSMLPFSKSYVSPIVPMQVAVQKKNPP